MRHTGCDRLFILACALACAVATVTEDRSWYVNGAMDSADPWGNTVATWKCFTIAESGADTLVHVLAGKSTYAAINVTISTSRPYSGNAHVTLVPGYSTSLPPSFNVTLTGAAYLGNTVFVLHKLAYDLTRAREHLALDLLLSTPNIVGFVKKFVRLSIDGADYGLYTYTEAPNAAWLDHHGLAKGMIYAATNYVFKNATGLVLASAKGYSATTFNAIAAPQTLIKDSHASFIAMTTAVGNASIATTDLVAQYFDEDNLITFLAVEALLGNQDCIFHNYVLYQAYTGGAWFIFPYNFETSMRYYSKDLQAVFARVTPRWFEGVGGFYANALYARLLNSPYFVGRILATAAQLQTAAYNAANARAILTSYHDTVFAGIFTSTDQYTLPQAYPFTMNDTSSQGARTEWEAAFYALSDDLTTNYNNLQASVHYPSPGYTAVATTHSNTVYTFTWDALASPYGCVVTTDLTFYKDAALTEVLYAITGLQGITIDVAASVFQPATQYFYRFVNRAAAAPTTQFTEAFAADFITPDPDFPGYSLHFRGVNTFNSSTTPVNASATYATTPAVSITNTITINNVKYATLDNANPTDTTTGCQNGYIRVPAGWVIAPNTAITRANLKKANSMFGTRCLVLADGVSVVANTGGSCMVADPSVNAYLFDGGNAGAGVGIKWCPMRVLLVDATSASSAATTCRNDGVIGMYATRGAAPPSDEISYTAFNDTRPGATAILNLTAVTPEVLPTGFHLDGGAAVTAGGLGGNGGTLTIRVTNEIVMNDVQAVPEVPDIANETATTPVSLKTATNDMFNVDVSNYYRMLFDSDITTSGSQDAVRSITGRDLYISGLLRAGLGPNGRQSLTLIASDTVWVTGIVDLSGAAGTGENGGTLTIQAKRVVIEGTVTTAGGSGVISGGFGGLIVIKATTLIQIGPNGVVSSAGGDCISSSAAVGGDAALVRLQCNGPAISTGTITMRGGYGYGRFYDAQGGAGANVTCNSDSYCQIMGTVDARGGNAGAQLPGGSIVAGHGGAVVYGDSAPPTAGYLGSPINLLGGYGFSKGGVGGYVYLKPRQGHTYWAGVMDASGGNSSTLGGAGGTITSFPGPNSTVSVDASSYINGTVRSNGGSIIDGAAGNGGLGGYIKISYQNNFGGTYFNETGFIQLNGGIGRGNFTGGAGGMIYVYCLDGTHRLWGHVQTNGGNAYGNGSVGGVGGFIYFFTDNNHGPPLATDVANWGILYVYPGCVLESSGGNGTALGGDARNNRGSGVRTWPSVQDNEDLVEDTAILLNNDGMHGASTGYTVQAGLLIANGGFPNGWGGDVQYHGNGPPNAWTSFAAAQGNMQQYGNGDGHNGDFAAL